MALQILPILQVIVILCSQSANTYPVYGTKRYGRSTSMHRISSPNWNPYQQMVRTQRYPLSYYELYPSYSQNYPDDYYYPQENYPVYYPARTSKYEVYQAVLPYYYGERPLSRTNYGYYGYGDNEPTDFQDEIMQASAREEREESQPIGQEMLYENDNSNKNDNNLDDVNVAFLQNLIMSQIYKDAIDNQKDYYDPTSRTDYYPTDDVYGKWETEPVEPMQSYRQEDEDVRELKQLARSKDIKEDTENIENIHWFQNKKYKNQDKQNREAKRASIEINSLKQENLHTVSTTSTTAAPKTTDEPKTQLNGQKEEVLVRPATPVRHPFSAPVLDMMNKNEEDRKRTPSVYDTIKHMLDMEKNMEDVSRVYPSTFIFHS